MANYSSFDRLVSDREAPVLSDVFRTIVSRAISFGTEATELDLETIISGLIDRTSYPISVKLREGTQVSLRVFVDRCGELHSTSVSWDRLSLLPRWSNSRVG